MRQFRDPSFPNKETLLKSRTLKDLIYNKRFLRMITSLQPHITRFNDWVSVSEKLTRNAKFFTVKYVNKISYVCLKTKLTTTTTTTTTTKQGFLTQIHLNLSLRLENSRQNVSKLRRFQNSERSGPARKRPLNMCIIWQFPWDKGKQS